MLCSSHEMPVPGSLPTLITRKADVVIDTVGGNVQRASFNGLKRGGPLISSVSPPDADLAARYGVRVAFFIVSVTTDGLERISKLIDARRISVNVGSVLPLAQAPVAHEMLAGTISHPPGKIVLELHPLHRTGQDGNTWCVELMVVVKAPNGGRF